MTDHTAQNSSYYAPARVAVLICYFGLLATMLFGLLNFGPPDLAPALGLWLLVSSGLFLVMPGLVKEAKRSYQWLCFIFLMYFIWYVQAIFATAVGASPVGATHEWVGLALIVIGFCAAMFAARGKA